MANPSWRDRKDSDFELHDPAPSESMGSESTVGERIDRLEVKLVRTVGRIDALRKVAMLCAAIAATVVMGFWTTIMQSHSDLNAVHNELGAARASLEILREEVQELRLVLLQRGAEDLAGAAAVAPLPLRPLEGMLALRVRESHDDYGVPVVAVHHGRVVSIQDEGQVIPGSKKGVHWGVASEHAYGSLMRYGRLSDIADDLAVGKTIRKGQAIGTVSPT